MTTSNKTAAERTGLLFGLGPRIVERSVAAINKRFPNRYVLVGTQLGRGHLVAVDDWRNFEVSLDKDKILVTLCGERFATPDQVAVGRGVCNACSVAGRNGRIVRVRKGARR
jgi:hypothetical protein